jgi:hypothetical protein
MPSEAEIEAAIDAFRAKDEEVEGIESGKALRLCWKAALEAAERARRSKLPELRCDDCDNGIDDLNWRYCAWCGKQGDWEQPGLRTELPSPPESGK